LLFEKKEKKRKFENVDSYDALKEKVNQIILGILRENPFEKVTDSQFIRSRQKFRKDLRNALKFCMLGDKDSKVFVRDVIEEILCSKLHITQDNINQFMPFQQSTKLSVMDKFFIMLYIYEKKYQEDAFKQFMIENHLERPKINEDGEEIYEISEKDIVGCYAKCTNRCLSFVEEVCILAQKIYQETKGNGIIDPLLNMNLDGISAGVSGGDSHCVWVFFQGKSIRLSFLCFSTEKELVRICKNIYRYRNPGQLSEVRGYIVNELMDGSRVSVARPPFCESWVFFIRKFDHSLRGNMEMLINDVDSVYPIRLIGWLIKGCQVVSVTGEQGSGKTTLLMSMIRFIRPTYNIRIQEQAFELHLRKIYPERNIVSFRETSHISAQEGIDFTKKTDGTVNILGEVATGEVCSQLIQMGQVASCFTLFTHHAKTTKDLLFTFRNALLLSGGFNNEVIALGQVVHVLRFDVHMHKATDGHRYIERISEVIPTDDDRCYEVKDLLVYDKGRYELRESLSESAVSDILKRLNEKEKIDFMQELQTWGMKRG